MIGDTEFVKTTEQIEIDAGDEAVFEFGIGEAVSLAEQYSFEHGKQGIGGTAAMVADVADFLTVKVLLNGVPIDDLFQL